LTLPHPGGPVTVGSALPDDLAALWKAGL
jgi:hypothetical protein